MRKPTLSSCTKQYSHRRRARSMTRRRADSSISRATDQDLSRAPFGHPKDVFQIDDPRTRFLRDHRSARAMIGILERGVGTHGGRLIDPLSDALAVSLGWRA